MNGMRVPVVAGVGGGVGTTTVAVGLRGHDGGRVARSLPDILVCRATLDSLRRATAVLGEDSPEPPPVLAVQLDTTRGPRGPLRAHLELLEPDIAALVLLPHVRRWCTLADPLAEAAGLLAGPVERLPRPLRAYAMALQDLAAAVADSGRLSREPDDLSREHSRRPAAATPAPGAGRVSDERHSRHTGPDRRTRVIAVAARPTRQPGSFPDERHFRRIGSDERAARLDGGAAAPPQQRLRGVQIVAPDAPRRPEPVGPNRPAEQVG